MVSSELFTKVSSDLFVIEASELGLLPGCFFEEIETSREGKFHLYEMNDHFARYIQDYGDTEIHVLND